jgi:integrase
MPWQRKSKAKGERVIRRTLADGSTREYRYAKYKPRPAQRDTVSALVDAYMSSPEWAALSKSSRDHLVTYLKPLAQLGDVPITDVRRRDIIAIHDGMKAIGNGAANGFLKAARSVFAWGIDKEWLETSPTLRVKQATLGHWRAWTSQEADKAEAGLPEHLRRVVVLARHTGQRRADLCAMTWGQYDGTSIRVTQQKSKPGALPVKLVIPCTPVLREELEAWRQTVTAVTILTDARGRPWKGQSLSHALPYALAKLGLPPELNCHGLRKLCASELANVGCSPHEIMSITGHRTLSMVELYTRSADQERLATAAVHRLQFPEKRQTTNSKSS